LILSLCVHIALFYFGRVPQHLQINTALLSALDERPLIRDTFVTVTPPQTNKTPPTEIRPTHTEPTDELRPTADAKHTEAPRPPKTSTTQRRVTRPTTTARRATHITPPTQRPAQPTPSTERTGGAGGGSATASAGAVVAPAMALSGGEGARVAAAVGAGAGGGAGGGAGAGVGTGAGLSAAEVRGLQRGYYDSLNALMRRAREYPRAARRQGLEGVVLVELVVDSAGGLVSARVVKSSGYEVLDSAALSDVRRLERLPEPPRALNRKSLKLHIPFEYRLQA
jgi:protein TonB